MSLRFSAVVMACGLLLGAVGARAQCANWLTMPFAGAGGANGTNNPVQALMAWDPDGGGPKPSMLVAAGSFTTIEGVAANRVAARDPATGQWQALGTGVDDQVRCLAVYNGELIAGGLFTHAGGQSASYIARWNGSAWQSLGTGMGSYVYALAVYNGELIAAGYFLNAGGGSASHIARWNGSTWQPLGSGIDDWVVSLGVYGSELIAGGYFATAGGVPANRVARWNGSSWQAMGSGMNLEVLGLQVFNGGIVAGGRFTTAGGVAANRVAFWNGTSWQAMGAGMDNTVVTLSYFNGELVAGGVFLVAGGQTVGSVTRWSGGNWQPLGFGIIGGVYAMFPYADELVAGGSFTDAGAQPASSLAHWNGFEWGSYGGGTANSVNAMTLFNGRLIAGGDFHQSTAAGPSAHFLTGWDGASFSAYGTGLNGPVMALKAFLYPGVLGSTELIAAGGFSTAGGVSAIRIARWTQSMVAFPPPAWAPMGAGFNNWVYALERHNSVTYAGGAFTASSSTVNYIARWNETTDVWEPLGSGMNGIVLALKSYGGYLYAGGAFTTAGGVATGGLARWDGASWSQVGGFFNGVVYALEVHNGQLVMAGSFPGINSSPNLAQWNGSFYTTFGTGGTNGTVRALKSTGSRLYVGGQFTSAGGIGASHVAYWDGGWHDVAGGTNDNVYALAYTNGEVHAGGAFGFVAGGALAAPRWAKFSETGVPWIAHDPSSVTVQPGDNVTFSATPAAGYGGLGCQWYRFDAPLVNGPTGTGSTISGADTPTLTIGNISHTDYGNYWMALSGACGNDSSFVAQLNLTGSAAAPAPGSIGRTAFEAIGPNPARGAAQLSFSLAREAEVRFAVHDVVGRRMRGIALGRLGAGHHQLGWDARDGDGRPLGTGLYFVSFEVDGHPLAVRRLTVLR